MPLRRPGAIGLLAVALAGCGGSDPEDDQAAGRPAAPAPVEVRLVDCTDWRTASADERSEVVAALREFAGGPVGSPAGYGATLPDGEARVLFDSHCAQRHARRFKLYKLYTRAASYGSP
jgi:hypothetical protein